MPVAPSDDDVYKADNYEFFDPPNPNTVARALWDDMELLRAVCDSGADVDAFRPHVMKHVDTNIGYFLIARQDFDGFVQQVVGGVKHWSGIHGPPQCKVIPCQQLGRMPTPIVQNGKLMVRILVKCVKQYMHANLDDVQRLDMFVRIYQRNYENFSLPPNISII